MLKMLLFGLIFILCVGIVSAAELKITPKAGELWADVKGEVMVVSMAAVKEVWKEFALKLDDGEIIILIGEPTKNLANKTGKTITVSGVLKPRMQYQGKLVRVIEARELK